MADQIVVVSSGSIDGARSASATMDWLDAHGHGDLVRNAVAVINCVSRSAGGVDLDRVAEHFAGRCRAVVRIPFDPHLQEGAEVDLDRLDPRTRHGPAGAGGRGRRRLPVLGTATGRWGDRRAA